jgi:hypothetical protein
MKPKTIRLPEIGNVNERVTASRHRTSKHGNSEPRPIAFGEGVPFPIKWTELPEGNAKYQAYLCSREWSEKKQPVLDRCGGMCERCHVNEVVCVHHLTYEHKYDERPEELAAWCKGCHDFTHGKSNYDPAAQLTADRPLSDICIDGATEGWAGKSVIVCPHRNCDCGNVHFTSVDLRDGDDDYKAGWEGRGDLIVIPMWCEGGHEWELCFGFHKGTTVSFTRNLKESSYLQDD